VFDESKISIQRLGGIVVVLYMQQADLNGLGCEKGESGNREGTSEALSVECGVDGNDKDFAELRIGRSCRVDSGPAEPGQGPVDLMKQKPFGVEPWFAKSVIEMFAPKNASSSRPGTNGRVGSGVVESASGRRIRNC